MFAINNLPRNYTDYAFITAREVDGDLWYYGAWNDREGGNNQAREIGGILFTKDIVVPA